jgi:hypothetical protein
LVVLVVVRSSDAREVGEVRDAVDLSTLARSYGCHWSSLSQGGSLVSKSNGVEGLSLEVDQRFLVSVLFLEDGVAL